jgi:hypothetical protein
MISQAAALGKRTAAYRGTRLNGISHGFEKRGNAAVKNNHHNPVVQEKMNRMNFKSSRPEEPCGI